MSGRASTDLEHRILNYYSGKRARLNKRAESVKPRLMRTLERVLPPVDDSRRIDEFFKCEKHIMPES